MIDMCTNIKDSITIGYVIMESATESKAQIHRAVSWLTKQGAFIFLGLLQILLLALAVDGTLGRIRNYVYVLIPLWIMFGLGFLVWARELYHYRHAVSSVRAGGTLYGRQTYSAQSLIFSFLTMLAALAIIIGIVVYVAQESDPPHWTLLQTAAPGLIGLAVVLMLLVISGRWMITAHQGDLGRQEEDTLPPLEPVQGALSNPTALVTDRARVRRERLMDKWRRLWTNVVLGTWSENNADRGRYSGGREDDHVEDDSDGVIDATM